MYGGGLGFDVPVRFPEGQSFRIDLASVHQHLVVEMGTGRNARRADIADDIAAVDPGAGSQHRREAQEMAIGGLETAAMAQANVVAVIAPIAEVLNHAV